MIRKIQILLILIITVSCTNPFAPKLADKGAAQNILSDQKSVAGVFENFRYAYMFKDTLVYGRLLAPDFTFIYRNYERGADLSWGRQEDMMTTYGLFRSTQTLDLIWNDVIVSIGDSLLQDISRGFSLTIVFNPSDIIQVQGRANFRLSRFSTRDIWQIKSWRDESNY